MKSIVMLLAALAGCACSASPTGNVRMLPTTDELLREQSERALIADTTTRFADAANRHDWEAMLELFVDDAIWEASAGQLGFRHQNRRAMREWLLGNVGKVEVVSYLTSAPAIEFVSPERARSRVSMTEVLRIEPSGELKQLFGTYTDELVKRAGRWRFAERRFVLRHQHDLGVSANIHDAHK